MQWQRITTSTRWLPEIDGLRFVAISAVLLAHVLNQFVNRSAAGHAQGVEHPWFLLQMNHLGRGVLLFFTISGFILAKPFVRQFIDHGKPVLLGDFYLRRLTRLEPPYLLSLLLYAAAHLFFKGERLQTVLPALGAHCVYLTQVLHNHVNTLNFVTWSLEVEVQFYLLTPLLARLFLVRPAMLRRLLLLGCILMGATVNWSAMLMYKTVLPMNLCYFLTGFLLADLRIAERARLRHAGWDVAGALLWPACFLLPDRPWTAGVLCLLLFSSITAAMGGPLTRGLLSCKPIAVLGGACYSVYLLHMLIISMLFPLTSKAVIAGHFFESYAVQVVLLLPCVLLVSLGFYLLVEQPCMNPQWPQNLWRRLHGSLTPRLLVADQ